MRLASALLLLAGLTYAQHTPRGAATDISGDEIAAVVKANSAPAVSDKQIRVVNIDNEYNIGVGVVQRKRTEGKQAANGIEHSQITEIYHVLEGTATLVTGGDIENVKETPATSQIVTVLNGPSSTGGAIKGGTSRPVKAGDVIVIPPNTPHWFSEITSDRVVYLVIRVDPHKVLPAGYDGRQH
jgi:mannose-6-phosphate isomerase-like protein (cupin superfamily)